MKQFLFAALVLIVSPFVHAQLDVDLDDLMSPEEIEAERREQNPEVYEGSFDNLLHYVSAPRVRVLVNKAAKGQNAQTMWVAIDGELIRRWPVSTGREKRETKTKSGRVYFSSTPTGEWTPYDMTYLHRSKLWGADMPFSIWLTGGIAIHAASQAATPMLGQRASGGCVRLAYENAEELWGIIKQYGRTNTKVTIINKK